MRLRFGSSLRLVSMFLPSVAVACGDVSGGSDFFGTPAGAQGGAGLGQGGAAHGGTDALGSSGAAPKPEAGRASASAGAGNTGGSDEAGAGGDAGAPRGGRSGGGRSGGGRAGAQFGGSAATAGEAAQAGGGGVDCDRLLEDVREKLAAAQECRVDLDRRTCVGVVTDPCGCQYAVDLQDSEATRAYEAAVESVAKKCMLFCPDRYCPPVEEGQCISEGTSIHGECQEADR